MPDQTSDSQKHLVRAVSEAISKLAQADQSNIDIKRAYKYALNLQTLINRPIRIAVGGEFSSGKSTFVKMLLGRHVVETQASASAMPTVHFLYGSETIYRAISTRSQRKVDDIGELSEDDLRRLEYLEVTTDIPFLKGFEVFDTPGTSDPSRDFDQILTVADQVDFIVWCTNATQAWRESERQVWESLPTEQKEKSLLLVSHVDLPNVKASLERLMKRLHKEAGPLFHKIIPLELLGAVSARDSDGKVTDETTWVGSGGADCFTSIETIAATIRLDILEKAENDLEHKIMPVVATLGTDPTPFLLYWASELGTLKMKTGDADNATILKWYLAFLDTALEYLSKSSTAQSKDTKAFTPRLKEARDYIRDTLNQGDAAKNIIDARVIIEQLEWEFGHLNMLSELNED